MTVHKELVQSIGPGGIFSQREGRGTPVLLIHGILCDHTYYNGLAGCLKDSCRVITYDRRGYGESVYDGEDYSLKAQAEDAASVLENEEPVFAVGHSAGGIVAAELAVRYPGKVKGLLLIEPGFAFCEAGAASLRAWNEELMGYIRDKRLGMVMKAFAGRAGAPGKGPARAALTKEALVRAKRNLENFAYGEIQDIQGCRPAEEDLRNLTCPVTAGVTELGQNGFFGTICREDAALMGWPIRYFPGNHNSLTEYPEEYAKGILGLLGAMEMQR